jgi:hypothetical protein
MRSSNVENLTFVCWGPSLEELQALVNRERVEGYNDGKWGKGFRKFGPLEWFNQPWDSNLDDHYIQAPPTILLDGFIEYRQPVIVNLPSIQELEEQAKSSRHEAPNRFERIAWNLVE